ncbi:TetR/AcrR family transcriptional regulator C-terminal domain-containing protein [Actinomadura sp. 6N118]|uniref:TetR/AcrR family transcriptional regulator C-terminal domain-containing protein n=1 Tax=Actinomadura sp. 6N118 TaxID=3375151 RepID=UPI0037A35951
MTNGERMALSRLEIARAGLRRLNDVGLGGLSLQRIADELGVKAPALYWHVKNKQELLDEMATQMLREATGLPGPAVAAEGGWEAWLREFAQAFRRMLLSYRDGAKVFAGTFLTDPAVPDPGLLQPLLDAGLEPRHAGRAWFTVYAFVLGFTIEEQAVHPAPGQQDQRHAALVARREQLGSPAAEAEHWAFMGDADERFGDGLAILLGGIQVWVGRP